MSEIVQPTDLMTFQWVAIGALITVVTILWRELRRSETSRIENKVELLTKVLAGLSDSNEVIANLVRALDEYQEQLGIQRELEQLRREIQRNEGSD